MKLGNQDSCQELLSWMKVIVCVATEDTEMGKNVTF